MARWSRWLDPARRTLTHEPRGVTRRAVLVGAGTVLALPWLPSLLPRGARAAGPGTTAWVAINAPNGMWMPSWTPSAFGADYALTPTLQPFAPLRDRMAVLTGLVNGPGISREVGTHARECATWLTSTPIPIAAEGVITNDWSIDQRLAEARAADFVWPSLPISDVGWAGWTENCTNYSCVFYEAMSWRGSTPVFPIGTGGAIWEALFGRSESLTAGATARRQAGTRSVLDAVVEDAAAMDARLGAADRRRLDEYLTGVREVERRLSRPPAPPLDPPPQPSAGQDNSSERAIVLDLLKVALEAGLTSVSVVLFGRPGGGGVFWELGQSEGHHALSHHQGDAAKIAQIQDIDLRHAELVAAFAQALDAVPGTAEGSTLLDETVILYGSGNSDGDTHRFDDLPTLVLGGTGRLALGRHHDVGGRPLADLHVTLAQAVGVDVGRHGDSTGPIEALLA